MNLSTIHKHWSILFTSLMLIEGNYQIKYFIKTINAAETATPSDSSNVDVNIFETYFKSSLTFRNPEDFFPLFPIIRPNVYFDGKTICIKESLETSKKAKMEKYKLSKSEIDEILALQSIESEFFEIFSTFIKKDICCKYCCIGEEKRSNLRTNYKFKKLLSNDKTCSEYLQLEYKNNIYLIQKKKFLFEKINLFIPELAFFDHKYIGKIYGTFLDIENLNINYTIIKTYELDEVEFKSKFNFNKNNHNLSYNSLKMVLCIATAIEYLNKVHNRVHGNISAENIIATKEGDRMVYKLIDFDNSFKLDEENGINTNLKRKTTCYVSSEEDSIVFQKSEVWSIGVLLMKNCNFNVSISRLSNKAIFYGDNFYHGFSLYGNRECYLMGLTARLKEIIDKILVINVKERLNISDCIELLYNRVIAEEKYLIKLYEAEEQCIEDEKNSLLNSEFHANNEKEQCLKALEEKGEELIKRKKEFYIDKSYTSTDWNDFIFEKATYETKKVFVDKKSYLLNSIYKKRLDFIKKNGIKDQSNESSPSSKRMKVK